jgi:hypothetical protein
VVKVVSGELNDAVGMLRGTPVFGSVLGRIHWKILEGTKKETSVGTIWLFNIAMENPL